MEERNGSSSIEELQGVRRVEMKSRLSQKSFWCNFPLAKETFSVD